MRLSALLLLGVSAPALALADAPRVATDIPPIHSLASMVMDGVGTPDLILPPGASPHGYSMRPSEARMLQNADVVFWVGGALTPWFEEANETLAEDATSIELLEVEGIIELPYRESAIFEIKGDHDDHDHGGHDDHEDHDDHEEHAHDHDKDHEHEEHAHDHDKDHDHEEHAHDHDKDHDHEEHADHDKDHDHEEHADHDKDHDHEEHAGHDHDEHGHDHHGHDHSGADPHAWLDPDNAKIWLSVMADTLSEVDPDNAATYRANAEAAQAQLSELEDTIAQKLDASGDIAFVVYHDAYQYFENRFDAPTRGAISVGDASAPGAARVAELRDLVEQEGISCVFAEPQFNPTLINAVFEEANVQVGVLDPVGADIETGAGLYPALLTQLADAMASCGDGN